MSYVDDKKAHIESVALKKKIDYKSPIIEEFSVSEHILGGVPQYILESQGGIYAS